MSSEIMFTEFAPAERISSVEQIQAQAAYFSDLKMIQKFVNAVPDVFLVLNEYRQIIFSNKAMLDLLGIKTEETIYGLRLGEVLDCIHAHKNTGGCGTTEFCKTCGAVNAMLSGLRGEESVQECRISQKNGNSLDLRVWATPLSISDKNYTMFAITDISNEKRRRVLERIFFHDILNTAGGLQGVSELLQDATIEELDELKGMVYALADRLVEEIQMQRMLAAAENKELAIRPVLLHSISLLQEIANFYKNHEVAESRHIQVDPNAYNASFTSDKTLLSRVIGNMVKNALEASKPGDTVTLGCKANQEGVILWVHNPTFMPKYVQLQVFQRSFSTKGAGRGLGTYSIKLLSSQYLKGNVWFTTSEEKGTTFAGRYPLTLTVEK